MINIYKNKKDIPNNYDLIEYNDIFFNKFTSQLIDDRAKSIISEIDGAKLIGKYKIQSKFGDMVLDIDKLSSGCKTVLNIIFNPNKVFSIKECGDNALNIIYNLDLGNVFCEYTMISFDMKSVNAIHQSKQIVFDDYEKLKEWWDYED